MPNTNPNQKAYLALVLVCIIWGTTYLVNKLGVTQMPPLFFTSIRQLIAGSILIAFLIIIKGEKWPDKNFLYMQTILGFLLISCGNGLGIFGLQYIDSGISAILATFSPILIAFLMSILKSSHSISRWTWIGLCLGTLGIIIICLQKIGTHPGKSSIIGILFTMASVIAWAFGSVYSKLHKNTYPPFMSAGFQMFIGGIPVFILSLIIEKPLGFQIEQSHLMIWAYTIIIGSLVAYSCYIYALNHLPVTLVSIHTYINPIIAILLGTFILNESLNIYIIIGALVTFTGVYIVTRHRS
ncbi:MAG: EamA family transporter [Saprospiraceae bacterium]|nr:EamA family transporter [Saprospiraceae bacterium]